MNAEEARQKSIENAKHQLDKIKSLIEDAVNKGETGFVFHGRLLDGSILWLNKNGYQLGKIYQEGLSTEHLRISW